MKRYFSLIVLFVVFFMGCGNSVIGPKEPAGTPVELSSDDREAATSFIFPNLQEWYSWHIKGMSLTANGRYQEALYCYNKAMAAWPKTIPAEQEKKSIGGHFPEATDTILQKAALYIKMKEPKLALFYLEKFKKYFPYDQNCSKMIEEAKKMMGKL